jgi:hypothetical protein
VRLYLQIIRAKRAQGLAYMAEDLPRKHETLAPVLPEKKKNQ